MSRDNCETVVYLFFHWIQFCCFRQRSRAVAFRPGLRFNPIKPSLSGTHERYGILRKSDNGEHLHEMVPKRRPLPGARIIQLISRQV
jgi:hypothetical protein